MPFDEVGDVEDFEWDSDTALRLIGLGAFLGCFHVLTPDHLSALSALSVGGSWKSFYLGVRWSFGHSIGLLLVMCVFLFLKGDLDLRIFGKYCDSLVGIFMIVIGCYGIVGSLKTYKYKKGKRADGAFSDDDEEVALIEKERDRDSESSFLDHLDGSDTPSVTFTGSGSIKLSAVLNNIQHQHHQQRRSGNTSALSDKKDAHELNQLIENEEDEGALSLERANYAHSHHLVSLRV